MIFWAALRTCSLISSISPAQNLPPDVARLLFEQEDRTRILLLLLLMLEENQDPSLLMALLYLALTP